MKVWVVHVGCTVYGVFTKEIDAMKCRAEAYERQRRREWDFETVWLSVSELDKSFA